MVGPHMPWPMMNTPDSLPNGPSSCCQITRSIGEEPRPPYSFGQCRQAQPASAFFFCQSLATSRILALFSAVRLGAERGLLRGVVEVHSRCPLSRVLLAHAVDQLIFPIRKTAERHGGRVG